MGESAIPCARHAIIGGSEASFVELVSHADGRSSIVIYTVDGSRRLYATEVEWRQGATLLAQHIEAQAAERQTTGAQGLVTSKSSAKDKLSFFRSLFVGRGDMYAHGYRKRSGGIGYTPACANEWVAGICPKRASPHARCAGCPQRSFIPLSNQTLVKHFNGDRRDLKDVVGLYVVQADCTVSLLVADFDGAGWQRESLAYVHAGRSLGVDVALERSRSGDGAHAWVFFDEPLPSSLARDFGSLLITRAMDNGLIRCFDAYDRFYPAQDTIAKGGFGSLIALPFQGQAQRLSNSVFVDDQLKAHPDQWRYLSSVRKTSRALVERTLAATCGQALGELAFLRPRAKEAGQGRPLPTQTPSEGLCPDGRTEVLKGISPSLTVAITKSNMLFINRCGLPATVQGRIRRLATLSNPEFYRAQAMRQSVYGKPRIIDQGLMDETTIAIPRGCEKGLLCLLDGLGISYHVEDRRFVGTPIRASFTGNLRPSQQTAADELLRHECGILSAPTGFGKTVIAAYLIGTLRLRTLVIVPSTPLLDQWQERLATFLSIDEELPELLTKTGRTSRRRRSLVGRIGGGRSVPGGIVDIATYQSLLEGRELSGRRRVKGLVRGYGMVICDECQHGAAPQLAQVLATTTASRVYGLSATPRRSDGLEGILYMQCGAVVHRVDPRQQAQEQGFARLLEPRFTHIRLAGIEAGSSFNQVLDRLCAHPARNRLIAQDTVLALRAGRRPLVITRRREHATLLAKLILEQGFKVFLLSGAMPARERREQVHEIAEAADDVSFAVVATGSYLGEGFDEPRLDTLVLATPVSWEGVVTQYLGRLHREREGKNEVIVYDYVDTSVPMLDRMYKKRLKSYARLGYELIPASDDVDRTAGSIVGPSDCESLLFADLDSSERSVHLAVPYLSHRYVLTLRPRLSAVVERGVHVSIVVNQPKDPRGIARAQQGVELLRSMGCLAELREWRRSALAIFDESIVWHGSLPLLARPHKDDCSLRLTSSEVAYDLLRDEGLATRQGGA